MQQTKNTHFTTKLEDGAFAKAVLGGASATSERGDVSATAGRGGASATAGRGGIPFTSGRGGSFAPTGSGGPSDAAECGDASAAKGLRDTFDDSEYNGLFPSSGPDDRSAYSGLGVDVASSLQGDAPVTAGYEKVSPMVLIGFESSSAELQASSSTSTGTCHSSSATGPAFPGCDVSSAASCGGPLAVVGGASLAPGGGAIPAVGVDDVSSVVGDLLSPVSEDASSHSVGGLPPPVAGGAVLPVGGGPTLLAMGDGSVESDRQAKPSTSSLRRSQRHAAKRDNKCEDETYLKVKSRKSLFPMFVSLKRSISQAISPEGKYDAEPGSKKAL